jgi:hypothetical protein
MHTCVYSFSNGDLPFYSQSELLNLRSPPFHSWQRPLLWALLGAQLLAFVALLSLCLSFHPPMRRLSAVAFLVCMASAGQGADHFGVWASDPFIKIYIHW